MYSKFPKDRVYYKNCVITILCFKFSPRLVILCGILWNYLQACPVTKIWAQLSCYKKFPFSVIEILCAN